MASKCDQWMAVAWGEMGTEETPGPQHNPEVVKYHHATNVGVSDDETAWCSSFCCWCVEQTGIASTKSAAARSWLNWGREIKAPVVGCIVVLSRGTEAWQGHVGFYVGAGSSPGSIKLLGGNQGDKVSVAEYDASRVLGYRLNKRSFDSTTIQTATVGAATTAATTALELHKSADTVSKATGGLFDKYVPYLIGGAVTLIFLYIMSERLKKIWNDQQ